MFKFKVENSAVDSLFKTAPQFLTNFASPVINKDTIVSKEIGDKVSKKRKPKQVNQSDLKKLKLSKDSISTAAVLKKSSTKKNFPIIPDPKKSIKSEKVEKTKNKTINEKDPKVLVFGNEALKKVVEQKVDSPEKIARTVFVGNVSKSITDGKTLKKFKKLISDCVSKNLKADDGVGGGAVVESPMESIRFRSIAFQKKIPTEMRKIAFRNNKLHESRDTMNAYIVFRTREQAVKSIELNGTVFEEKHLRFDLVGENQEKKQQPKQSIFIGNLVFDIAEETLYTFFEKCGDIDYVRVIRDPQTNLGKGFGYVQFSDPASVGLALKLNGEKVGENGREIRITKCDKKLSSGGQPSKTSSVKDYSGSHAIKGAKLRLFKSTRK